MKKNKLLILDAEYKTENNFFDGTKKLNDLIVDGKLKTTASNDIFGDPDEGKKKILDIKYSYNSETKTKVFNENDIVELP